jgi:hypothetical protein
MSLRSLLSGFALAGMLAGISPGGASAAEFWEKNFWLQGPLYDGRLPACDNQTALGHITSHFGEKEGVYWNSQLRIMGYENIHEVAYRAWAADAIPRRFCQGRVYMSDGTWHGIVYAIQEDTGMIGMTWGVEWCVVGLDRNWAYNPACKMAQP